MATVVSLATRLATPRLVLRPPRPSDVGAYLAALRKNEEHLRPVSPPAADKRPTLALAAKDIAGMRSGWRRDERYSLVLFGGRSARSPVLGRVTLSGIARGNFCSAFLGYWIDRAHQGQGLTTEAVGAVVTWAFDTLDLHRVQAAVVPKNGASVRVMEKLGFREEGLAKRYLKVGGEWADHRIFALTVEERRRA